jgi:hypothetical protein
LKPVFVVVMVAVVMIGMMIPNISAQDFSDKTSEPSFFSNIFQFFDSWFPENNSKSNLLIHLLIFQQRKKKILILQNGTK